MLHIVPANCTRFPTFPCINLVLYCALYSILAGRGEDCEVQYVVKYLMPEGMCT